MLIATCLITCAQYYRDYHDYFDECCFKSCKFNLCHHHEILSIIYNFRAYNTILVG